MLYFWAISSRIGCTASSREAVAKVMPRHSHFMAIEP